MLVWDPWPASSSSATASPSGTPSTGGRGGPTRHSARGASSRLRGPSRGDRSAAFEPRGGVAAGRVAALAVDVPVLVVSHGGVIRALERDTGVDAQTLTNLGGRWFDVDAGAIRAGPIVALLDL